MKIFIWFFQKKKSLSVQIHIFLQIILHYKNLYQSHSMNKEKVFWKTNRFSQNSSYKSHSINKENVLFDWGGTCYIHMRASQWIPGIFWKKQNSIFLFFLEFFSSVSTLHFLELVYGKKYFNLIKIFVLRLFRISTNETVHRLEQKSVIKSLAVEKCKLYEIDQSMYDVYREACFSPNIFTNGQNMGLSQGAWVKNPVHKVETHWLSSK